MILKRPTGSNSLLHNILDGTTTKNDINRSFYISRSTLNTMRFYLFIYSIFALGLTLSHYDSFCYLFTLPYCSLMLQTAYFGVILKQPLKKSKSMALQENFKAIGIIYEFVFSFQLFNFLYFWLPLLTREINWTKSSVDNTTWLSVSLSSLIAIWIEQLFNMIRFCPKHLCCIVGVEILYLLLTDIISLIINGVTTFTAELKEAPFNSLLLIMSPFCHFFVGNKYYCHKKQEKNKKRRRLSEALITFKAVKERVN